MRTMMYLLTRCDAEGYLTYENDNKTKRNTLPVVAGVRTITPDLCLMDNV